MQELALQARFAAALEAVPPGLRAGPIGLAVSGGSDSIALLTLARDWAVSRGASLLVLTVDHRLRPGSAAEAVQVASLAVDLGLTHRTLCWDAPVPRQSAARQARHALLAGALREAGGQLLLTGHTATDQAETVLMRARQGSGWYGLAGMRPLSLSPVWPEGAGIWIARPLLSETREALRGWLEGQGRDWIDDPSNTNTAFERVRTRMKLTASGGALLRRTLACQRGFARLRSLEDALLANWLARDVQVGANASLTARLDGLAPERAARGLGVLLQCVSGRETAPRSTGLADLAGRCPAPGFRGATLGGVTVRPGRAGLILSPEAGVAADAPDSAALAARVTSFQRLFINSAQEFASCSGKESFLQGLVPIFPSNSVSALRDPP